MVLKRNFWEGGEDESEFQKREFKRRYALPRDMSKTSPQKLESILEPLLRNWVKEEVDRVFNSHLRPSLNQNGSSGSRILQLHFEDKLPSTLFTGCRVESEDRKQVQIVLRDANSRKIITSGPLSSMKVNVLVLDGGFNADDSEDWTDLEFNNKTVHAREGKKPLVAGTLLISLREGVGYLEDISFTDNSRWIRSGKFRLGAKGQNSTSEVREGISNAFKVKDQRGESYKKHHPPSLADEVWRLEKIAKDGVSHKRLAKYEIFTVKDFLQMYNTRPSILRDILGGKISDKSWDTITGHATECLLDSDEHYMWKADGTTLVLNSIYKIVGTIFDGQNYQTLDVLDPFQKQLVENLKQHVYKNLNYLVPFVTSHLLPVHCDFRVRRLALLQPNFISSECEFPS